MALEDALKDLEPAIRDAFLAAVRDVRGSVNVADLAKAIQDGRTDDAIRLSGVDPAFWQPLDDALRIAFARGGRDALAALPPVPDPATGLRAVVRFDGRALGAEEWVRQHSADLVTEIIIGQRDAIRNLILGAIENGRGPRNTALDIVGRIGPSGRREGGIIGLTEQQAGYVTSARDEILSGDPNYFTRQLRDRNFDPMVRKAMESGEPLSAADLDRVTGRYSDRLLMHRGEVIARTESIAALHAGQYEGYEQIVASGKVPASAITKVWSATGDKRTRETHADMNGQKQPWGQPFISPSGAALQHPHDDSLGAPASEIIQCRCAMLVRIDYLAMAG